MKKTKVQELLKDKAEQIKAIGDLAKLSVFAQDQGWPLRRLLTACVMGAQLVEEHFSDEDLRSLLHDREVSKDG